MRKYTSKSQKVEMYSEKYGLPKEEVFRILSEHEDMLTLDELKIKYDNPNIGQLPEWLTEEQLSLIIWKTVHQYWSQTFNIRMTKEDLYNEHQIYIRKKIGLFENYDHIKAALVKRMQTLASEFSRKGKYFLGSTDETKYSKDQDCRMPRFNCPVDDDQQIEDDFLIEQIRSLKDKQAKNLLIITGYLLCNITSFEKDYYEVINSYGDDIKQNIKQIEQILVNNDIIKVDKNDTTVLNCKKQNVKFVDIMDAIKYEDIKKDSNYSVRKNMQKFREYIKSSGILSTT